MTDAGLIQAEIAKKNMKIEKLEKQFSKLKQELHSTESIIKMIVKAFPPLIEYSGGENHIVMKMEQVTALNEARNYLTHKELGFYAKIKFIDAVLENE